MTTDEEAKIRAADALIHAILDQSASSAVANLIEAHGLLIDALTPDDDETPGCCRSCRKWKLPCWCGSPGGVAARS